MTPVQASEDVLCSRIFKTDEISAKGVSGCLEVNAQERAAISNFLDLLDLAAMRMEFKLNRSGRGRFKLTAQLLADVTQTCVMTLEPVTSKIDERFTIEFWPSEDVARLETEAEQEGTAVPLDGPEPIVGESIDIGRLAYEHFASALDSYPRKLDAKFDWQDPLTTKDQVTGNNPFAELHRLNRHKDDPPE